MTYLIVQILTGLFIAFILGLILGMLLHKIIGGCKCKKQCCNEDDTTPKNKVEKNLSSSVGIVQPLEDGDDVVISLDTDIDLDGDAYGIETLEGVGPQTGDLFRGYGVASVGDYLRKLHNVAQRKQAALDLNILIKPLNDWASMCDLLRVEGIDHQFAELMLAAGVETVGHLANSDASTLMSRMEEVNSAGKQLIAPELPTHDQVADWVARAQGMAQVISVEH